MSESFSQAFQHAVVVNDQTEILAGITPVGTGNCLHQRVCPHRLINVERRQAFNIKPGQPHGTDNRDAKRMLRVLESRLNIHPLAVRSLKALLDASAVRNDVEMPFFEVGYFVLRLADDDLDDRFIHPGCFCQQTITPSMQLLPCLFIRCGSNLG